MVKIVLLNAETEWSKTPYKIDGKPSHCLEMVGRGWVGSQAGPHVALQLNHTTQQQLSKPAKRWQEK